MHVKTHPINVFTISFIGSSYIFYNDNFLLSFLVLFILCKWSISREMDTIEEHSSGLVDLLQVCQRHNLNPVTQDKDPPHAKVASDIMSCLFMVSKLKGKTTYFGIDLFAVLGGTLLIVPSDFLTPFSLINQAIKQLIL